jgi:hypothetical protein
MVLRSFHLPFSIYFIFLNPDELNGVTISFQNGRGKITKLKNR